MARVTVEDCAKVVASRFELVALAAQRAKLIAAGAAITVDRDNDKNAVVALREIAEGTVDADMLRELLVQSYQYENTLEPQNTSSSEGQEISDQDKQEIFSDVGGDMPKIAEEDNLYAQEDVQVDD